MVLSDLLSVPLQSKFLCYLICVLKVLKEVSLFYITPILSSLNWRLNKKQEAGK